MKKTIALLAALAMLMTLLAGCGAKKTPTEAFWSLVDEVAALENYETDLDMTMDVDGDEIDADLNVVTLDGGASGSVNGTLGMMGVSIEIPQIIISEDHVYLDGETTTDLINLLGIDYDGSLAAAIGSSDIMLALDTEAAEQSQLTILLTDLVKSVETDLRAREDLVTEDEENAGTYTLTFTGSELFEIGKSVINSILADQDSYISAIQDLAEDMDEEVDAEELKELFAELEDAMDELEDEDVAEEVEDLLKDIEMVITLNKDQDKVYHYTILLEMDIEGTVMTLDAAQTVTPLSKSSIPKLAIPEDTVSADDLLEVLEASTAYEDDYYSDDEYSYEEEVYGTVDDLNLTDIGGGLSEITMTSYNGNQVTLPVPSDVMWDSAYISEDLSYVAVDGVDYEYYANYSFYQTEYFSLQELGELYQDSFMDPESGDVMTLTEIVSNGNVSALAVYGQFSDIDLYDLVVAVDMGEETAVIDLTSYDLDTPEVDLILSYFGLERP